ncbi:S8 family serine peptidase [Polycladomyces sp. WAk]|uniref:S8 family serine peptidase n=2 Tax=Polycladomyces zharkentensis TaxID=2807616 RepID=A0ABS2WGS9_9BACL|nr:S8 family serine peptidase [Polycladomyces sp. WAk]MBN2908693.1 S8 family serine peptidase [Polycladomyces sp. WAk]
MDAALRTFLIQRYQKLRRVPCFLHNLTNRVINELSRTRVLIKMSHTSTASLQWAEEWMSETSRPTMKHFHSIGVFAARLSLSQLQSILEMPSVEKVYLDRKVYALLDTAVPSVGAPQVWSGGNEGEGVTIAVVDTGIHPHPDLTQPTNRIIAFKDFVKGKTDPYDDNGHGTHCAGCAAGNGYRSDGKYRGSAPKARLVGVKVLDKMGSGSLSSVIEGIQWCIDHRDKYGIRVISLSLGSTSQLSYKDDPVCQAVEAAWNHGITVVVAAGNEGPEPRTIASPGIHPRVITVGASDDHSTVDNRDNTIAQFSSRGPTIDGIVKPDLVAPGTQITSLRVKRSYLDKTAPDSQVDGDYTSLSGTSMATPIVAGIAALLLTSDPTLTPDQVKQRLLENAQDLKFPENEQGRGQVSA